MTASQPYPAVCPQCRHSEGWPVRAHTTAQPIAIRVDVRCRACGHHWTDLLESQPPNMALDATDGQLLLRRKPERRKSEVPPLRRVH